MGGGEFGWLEEEMTELIRKRSKRKKERTIPKYKTTKQKTKYLFVGKWLLCFKLCLLGFVCFVTENEKMNEKFLDEYFGSEKFWKYIFSVSTERYLLKLFWNLFCLLFLLCVLPRERISLFHPYMVKMWVFTSATSIVSVIYFSYYFSREKEFSHTVWALGRLNSVRQVWGSAGIALLLFRGAILIDVFLNVHARLQSPLIVLLDITQFLFWTSILFPFPVTVGFCFIESGIQLFRLWGPPTGLDWQLSILCTIIIILYSLTVIIVARSVLITIEKSCDALQGIQSISHTKHRMVHLLCSVILTPIHTIVEAIRNIDNNFTPFKYWNNRIVCATNQVVSCCLFNCLLVYLFPNN